MKQTNKDSIDVDLNDFDFKTNLNDNHKSDDMNVNSVDRDDFPYFTTFAIVSCLVYFFFKLICLFTFII